MRLSALSRTLVPMLIASKLVTMLVSEHMSTHAETVRIVTIDKKVIVQRVQPSLSILLMWMAQ